MASYSKRTMPGSQKTKKICWLDFAASFIAAISFSQPILADNFGKLFTSPEERAYLDGLRREFLEKTESEGFDIQAEAIPLLQQDEQQQNTEFTLEGLVTNQNGTRAIWLNGSAILENDLPADVRLVRQNNLDYLQIRSEATAHYIKTGQTIDLETGEIWEAFEEPSPDLATSEEEKTTSTQEETGNIDNQTETAGSSNNGGVVAIQDLILALQNLQSTNEDAPPPEE